MEIGRSWDVIARRLATALLTLWALAFWLSEGLLQGVASLSLLVCVVLVAGRRLALSREVRLPVVLALALASWQAVSPLLAKLNGMPGFPPSGLWLHCLDTAALASAALLGGSVARWTPVEATFLAGGALSVLMSFVQHQMRWAFPVPSFLRLPVDRVHETFGGEQRFAAGGFFFHRLRLAHASVAAFGPALAAALRSLSTRRRLLGAALCLTCLACIVLTYARAALLTVAFLVMAAGVGLARGWARRVLMSGVAVLAILALVSPGWRARLEEASGNFLGGERMVARVAGWDLIRQHPVLGVGFGNYRRAALDRAPVTGITDQLSRDAHAIVLTVWAETGLVGLTLFVALHSALVLSFYRRARAGNWAALGALLSWVGYQVLGVAHYLPFHPSVSLAFAFVWAAGLVHPGDGSPSPMARTAAIDTTA
jgi:O-antigen ligase